MSVDRHDFSIIDGVAHSDDGGSRSDEKPVLEAEIVRRRFQPSRLDTECLAPRIPRTDTALHGNAYFHEGAVSDITPNQPLAKLGSIVTFRRIRKDGLGIGTVTSRKVRDGNVAPIPSIVPIVSTLVELDTQQEVNHSPIGNENLADVPPVHPTEFACMSLVKRLQKVRFFHERLKANLAFEMEASDALETEEEELRNKLSKMQTVIETLSKRASECEIKCKETERGYLLQRENLRVTQTSLAELVETFSHDSKHFDDLTGRLSRLRKQRPRLDRDLAQLSDRCKLLTCRITEGLHERARLEDFLRKIVESNSQAAHASGLKSTAVQTVCDFGMFEDVELMRSDLRSQLTNMKKVKEAINLVRRCS